MATIRKDTRMWTHTLLSGAIAGIIAGLIMAIYAIVASGTFLNQGLFTPLYGMASPLTGPEAMMTSMKQGIFFSAGPALLGMITHLIWSVLYGIIFGLIVLSAHLRGSVILIAGLVYGFLVFLVMSYGVLPIVGAGGMPAMVGYPSFIGEHLLFGGVLGLWLMLRTQNTPLASPAAG